MGLANRKVGIAGTQHVSNYRIVLRGVKRGRSIDGVAQALGRYSKKAPEKLHALLTSGKPIVAKRTALAQQAMHYKLLLEKLGCDCFIEAEITGRLDSSNITSVLVTDVAGPSSDAALGRGVTYVQHTRLQEFAEKIARTFRPGRSLLLIILFVVLYFGWQQLRTLT